MNSDEIKTQLTKIMLVVLTGFATACFPGNLNDELSQYYPSIAAAAVALGFYFWSTYRTTNMKLVPEKATSILLPPAIKADNDGIIDLTPLKGLVKVVGVLAFGFLCAAFPFQNAIAQSTLSAKSVTGTAHTPPANSCDPQVIFKVGVNFKAFLIAIETCGADDFKDAIDNATSAPTDNAALACLQPTSTMVSALKTGGLVYKFQVYRRAKLQGFLSACVSYVNSTLGLQ